MDVVFPHEDTQNTLISFLCSLVEGVDVCLFRILRVRCICSWSKGTHFFSDTSRRISQLQSPRQGGGGTRHRPLPLRQYDNYIKLNTGNGREHSPTPEPSIAL